MHEDPVKVYSLLHDKQFVDDSMHDLQFAAHLRQVEAIVFVREIK